MREGYTAFDALKRTNLGGGGVWTMKNILEEARERQGLRLR